MLPTPATITNGGTPRVLLYCIAALLCMSAIAVPVAADINLQWSTSPNAVVNVYPATQVCAMEPNTLTATNIKNAGTEAANNVVVRFFATDVGGNVTPVAEYTIPTIAAGGLYQITAAMGVTDPTIRTTQGYTMKYWAMLDPDNLIAETSETDNSKLGLVKTVKFNGYKGVQFWPGKTAPQTYLTYDIHGDVIHSFGDSHYVSGKGSTWNTITWTWFSGTDPDPDDSDDPINIPEDATVKAVRLYIPYCWDVEHEMTLGTATVTFNGVTISPAHLENDTANINAYADYDYGLFTYDVKDLYVKNGNNVATLSRYYDGVTHTSPINNGQPGSLSPAGFTLMVVYEDPSETRKQIFINEGEDLLGASNADYGTTEAEATSYQEFTGMTIDMSTALTADLTTFVPWGAPQNTGDTGEGNLLVNGVQIGHNVWSYGERVVGESDSPQVAVDVRDILTNLNAGGTGNVIGIQSTAGASPCMVAERSFLVVEYPTAPFAAFSADPVSGPAPLTVTFTDASTNSPTSWVWTIEGTVGTDYEYIDSTSSTSQNPHVRFLKAGTYDVTLVATNAVGSDDEAKTDYITVSAGVVKLPGQANLPTDPDSDGLYEDLNGNGVKDTNDVVLFFKNLNWMKVNEPIASFDFNHNTALDTNDVVLLFKKKMT